MVAQILKSQSEHPGGHPHIDDQVALPPQNGQPDAFRSRRGSALGMGEALNV